MSRSVSLLVFAASSVQPKALRNQITNHKRVPTLHTNSWELWPPSRQDESRTYLASSGRPCPSTPPALRPLSRPTWHRGARFDPNVHRRSCRVSTFFPKMRSYYSVVRVCCLRAAAVTRLIRVLMATVERKGATRLFSAPRMTSEH